MQKSILYTSMAIKPASVILHHGFFSLIWIFEGDKHPDVLLAVCNCSPIREGFFYTSFHSIFILKI